MSAGSGTGSSKQKSKSTSTSTGGMPQEFQDIISTLWSPTQSYGAGNLVGGLNWLYDSILRTGRSGPYLPLVGQAEQAQRTATSSALRDIDASLASAGLAGTPFGERTRAAELTKGYSALGAIEPGITGQILQSIPGYATQLISSIFGALPGTRETLATSYSTGSGNANNKQWSLGI